MKISAVVSTSSLVPSSAALVLKIVRCALSWHDGGRGRPISARPRWLGRARVSVPRIRAFLGSGAAWLSGVFVHSVALAQPAPREASEGLVEPDPDEHGIAPLWARRDARLGCGS
jgi:hypothetical protein